MRSRTALIAALSIGCGYKLPPVAPGSTPTAAPPPCQPSEPTPSPPCPDGKAQP